MTKMAIDPVTGVEVEVEDTTAVNTVNGTHYLLAQAEKDDMAAREVAWQAEAGNRQKDKVRSARSPLLVEADIQINKHIDMGLDATDWRGYRIALRDVTSQADIYNVVWPTKPAII